MISGSTDGTEENDESNIDRDTIVDLLEKKDITWKSYQEDYPGGCNKEMDIDNYARKHNPFISFTNIQKDKKRCAKIVNAKQLDKDIEDNKVPQYGFYTPDVSFFLFSFSLGIILKETTFIFILLVVDINE